MINNQIKSISLESFLKESYIDESPAWEYINGKVKQKTMPQIHHSRLQLKLASKIDKVYQINSEETLPILDKIDLTLTVADIFAWLKMR
ncbi:MAG TPA: hypothetical protein DCF68_16350 [Cyanothece sp. UBA12306]|nr:hypothetical protein [Cyanothece sp. UBA12306]